jgi:hypothetical protein
LSRFIPNSDISRINHLAAGESVRVSRWTMECLELAREAYKETGGAFDISLGTGFERLQLSPGILARVDLPAGRPCRGLQQGATSGSISAASAKATPWTAWRKCSTNGTSARR